MGNRLARTQKLIYVPAVLPVPGRAAFCVGGSTQRSFAFASGSSGGSGKAVSPYVTLPTSNYTSSGQLNIPSGIYNQLAAGASSVSGQSGYSPYTPTKVGDQVCYPAIPAVPGSPSRYDYGNNTGWSAGARSLAQVPAIGFFRGVLPPSPVGVQIGFSRRTYEPVIGAMTHSLVARRDEYTIVESGIAVYGPQPLPAQAIVEIKRFNGAVTYSINGTQVYASAVPSAGEIYGGALLYSVGDYVDSPEIAASESPISFECDILSLVAAISETADYTAVDIRMPRIRLEATAVAVTGSIRFEAELPGLIAAIGTESSAQWVKSELPAISLSARLGSVEELLTSFIGLTPPVLCSAVGAQGEALRFSAELPVRSAIGEQPFNLVAVSMPCIPVVYTQVPYLDAGVYDGSDAIIATELHVLESALLLVALDSLEVAGSADMIIVLEMAAEDGISFSDDAHIGSIIEMIAMERIAVLSRSFAAHQQALQYAVNFMTGALTTYRDFDFLGFTYDEGQAYAWRKDGLYRLGGESEEVISALVDFGASDYGDAHLKRMAMAFVGLRTDGECYLRLCTDDGPERVYKMVGDSAQKRSILAKGVTGRTWNVRLELADATYATIDSVELEVGVTQRRGYGRRG
ncbi:hypothetical protein [Ectopseudomonas toyotomiensis]|uniref:Uncharacterized protein n=1 Tax=Ectopseudomonas toyotomiensis TaxID=554344 RepID=A0A1I5R2W3_9GAMM|nr:hypothetical protein [Pseudomonas toyotomiensis]SFP52829.1 hypothetical protein SAMN05216177_103263 [Pseudomonas toyotomiensis]